ncbi:MAG TPA: hypothetical protein VF759_09120 [Allosphingosinicella sp.]|jgi:hypothetical protein
MTETLDRIYRLLPTVHRNRDFEAGEPLRALLEVIAEQVALIEEDIERAYDNWFIETCEEWVIPYIGALVGYEPAGPAGEAARRTGGVTARREVANAVRNRARKGTLAMLERLAADIAGWPALAVEFREGLAQSHSLRLPRPGRGRLADARTPFDGAGGPFDSRARTADLRRLGSGRSPGRHGPANVGLFVWRQRAFPVTRAPARACEEVGPHCFTFSLLGNDIPLFARPQPARPDRPRFPERIGRLALAGPRPRGQRMAHPSPAYYGLDEVDGEEAVRSFAIWAPDWPKRGDGGSGPVPADRIVVADLEDWTYLPPLDHVAVDPERGRIAFPPRQPPRRQVKVSYHYGFPAEIGGGEYRRPIAQEKGATVIRVAGAKQLRAALERWAPPPLPDEDEEAPPAPERPRHAVIEITDSGVYVLPIRIQLEAGERLQLRAAQQVRPVLGLVDLDAGGTDALRVMGSEGSRFTLDGLLVYGRGVRVDGPLRSLTVRNSTLVPGWWLGPDCDPRRPAEPSIELIDSGACVTVDRSIVGSIQVNNDEVRTDPIRIRIADSIVDATGADCDSPQCEALGAAGSRIAFAAARFVRSTVIGRVMTHSVELGENSLFLGRMTVARRQVGCLRFCYVTPESRTPRRFQCQPDLAEAASGPEGAEEARARVRPRFDSLRYGRPDYCRLARACAEEIRRGADDEGEIGAYHHLGLEIRGDRLRARLEEYVPARCDAGIVFAD